MPPPAPPPVPGRSDADVAAEAQRQADIRRRAIGRASLNLTGGQGDTSPAPVASKILLGE